MSSSVIPHKKIKLYNQKQKDQGFSKGELQQSGYLIEHQILESATMNELHRCT